MICWLLFFFTIFTQMFSNALAMPLYFCQNKTRYFYDILKIDKLTDSIKGIVQQFSIGGFTRLKLSPGSSSPSLCSPLAIKTLLPIHNYNITLLINSPLFQFLVSASVFCSVFLFTSPCKTSSGLSWLYPAVFTSWVAHPVTSDDWFLCVKSIECTFNQVMIIPIMTITWVR